MSNENIQEPDVDNIKIEVNDESKVDEENVQIPSANSGGYIQGAMRRMTSVNRAYKTLF